MSYSDLLLDPRWQRRRLEILAASGWECRDCGAGDRTLHVHHTHYVKGRMPWEYGDDDLIVLCKTCHEQATSDAAEIARLSGRLDFDRRQWVIGYLKGQIAFQHGTDVHISDAHQMHGLSTALGCSDDLIRDLILRDGYTLGHDELMDRAEPEGTCAMYAIREMRAAAVRETSEAAI